MINWKNLFRSSREIDEMIRKERWKEEKQKLFETRMEKIKSIANSHMKKCERNHLRYRDSVVVDYEDLLKIWDIADRAKWE